MNKGIFLIVVIFLLLVCNISVESFQKKLYNTFSNRNTITDSSNEKSDYKDSYNVEDESVKFVYKFLNKCENNLNLNYLEENLYNTYSKDKMIILENYIKNFEVVDKVKNEIVIVKNGKSTNILTEIQYVNLTMYVVPKVYDYTSSYASEIKGNSPDANKKFTIVVSSDTPYNFKINLFLENNI